MYTLDIPLSSLARVFSLIFLFISLFLTIFFLAAATSPTAGIQRLYALEVTYNNTPGIVFEGTSIQSSLLTQKTASSSASASSQSSSAEPATSSSAAPATSSSSRDAITAPPPPLPAPPPTTPPVTPPSATSTSSRSRPTVFSTTTLGTPLPEPLNRRTFIPKIIGVNDNGCNDGVAHKTFVFHYDKQPAQTQSAPVTCVDKDCRPNGTKMVIQKVVKDGKITKWETVKVKCKAKRGLEVAEAVEELAAAVVEAEGECVDGKKEKRWRLEHADGETSTLTQHDDCATGLEKRAETKTQEPCKKGLRRKLFEYRFKNHVERYWMPVPCVECQKPAKRGVLLASRDSSGNLVPRAAPAVDCQRDVSTELDLDTRGDIITKRSEHEVPATLEHEGACINAVSTKTWNVAHANGESATLTEFNPCTDPAVLEKRAAKQEPCIKGLRRTRFEYRFKNHVERYWMRVPCVECQKKAKRGTILIGRDAGGMLVPRAAPKVSCQRELTSELDLDTSGAIVNKRAVDADVEQELVATLEQETPCENGSLTKRWAFAHPDGEMASFTEHSACEPELVKREANRLLGQIHPGMRNPRVAGTSPGRTTAVKRAAKKASEEPCIKGLRRTRFEYRFKNHVERYWMRVPCVECQKKAKRATILVGRDATGRIVPRAAPKVDCNRQLTSELDLDTSGDVVSKRSLWSPLLGDRGGPSKHRHDYANQTEPILVDEDELPPSYTITPGPCQNGQRLVSLAPIFNGSIILPCATLSKRADTRERCMENRTFLIHYRNTTHSGDIPLPCGVEVTVLPRNITLSLPSPDLGLALLHKRAPSWSPCTNGYQTTPLTYHFSTRTETHPLRRKCLTKRHHPIAPTPHYLRIGYYTLCTASACVPSRAGNASLVITALDLPPAAHPAVATALATQRGLLPELPLVAVLLLALALCIAAWPLVRPSGRRLHQAALLLVEIALTCVLLAICNIAWVLRGVEAGTSGDIRDTRVAIGRNGLVVAGVAVLFGVLAGVGLGLARMGEARSAVDANAVRELGQAERQKALDAARVESVVDMYADSGRREKVDGATLAPGEKVPGWWGANVIGERL